MNINIPEAAQGETRNYPYLTKASDPIGTIGIPLYLDKVVAVVITDQERFTIINDTNR